LKKQKIIIAGLNRVDQGFDNLSFIEEAVEPISKKIDGSTNRVSLQALLNDGWIITTGWPMGGGNIAEGQCDPSSTVGPFTAMILLEKEE
jgi:hypothetical protein